MSRSTLKAALIQDINHGDADANLSVIEQRVAEAAAAGARLAGRWASSAFPTA